jgi:TonB family protein
VERIGGGGVEPAPVEKKERVPQTKKEEPEKVEVKKKEEPPEVKEKKVAITKPEKKEPPKETKKEEPKKAEVKKEEPPKVKEEPKKKDTVVLDSKEKKEEKKEMTKKPEPTPPPKATSQKEPPKKKESSFEEIRKGVLEDMQKSVADKQRRSVIEDIEKSVHEEKQVADAESSAKEGANNDSQTGRSGSGAASGIVTSLFIERIRSEIHDKWTLPQSFSLDEGLRTVLVFKIDERGKVYDVKVEKSSGNTAFDDFCVKAVYKAAPLTPPPPELLEVAKTEGVEVTFEP